MLISRKGHIHNWMVKIGTKKNPKDNNIRVLEDKNLSYE